MEFGETLTGGAAAAPLLLLALLAPLLAWIAVADARRGIIPDPANASVAALGLLAAFTAGGAPLLTSRLIDAALVGTLLVALRALYRRRRGMAGLGLGDVKLLCAGTLWLGLSALFVALLLASLAGLGQALALRLAGREVGRATRLRFGPHLALAIGLVLLFDAAYGA